MGAEQRNAYASLIFLTLLCKLWLNIPSGWVKLFARKAYYIGECDFRLSSGKSLSWRRGFNNP
jgi:hypothetical protein